MLWDVMVAAAFVVVSAVLVCFGFNFILTWLKKPHQIAPQRPLLPEEKAAKEPLKLPKIRGEGGKAA
jgi:hypothetical protein